LAVAQESGDYKDISGAQDSFQYSISPLDRHRSWYVATIWHIPWCTSVWRSIHYSVIRPGEINGSPHKLLEGNHGSNISYAATVQAFENSFRITFADRQSLDSNLWVRQYIRSYSVVRSPPERIAPLGLKPEDFLDEWFELPWEDAKRWLQAGNKGEIEQWRKGLEKFRTEPGTLSLRFVQPCGNDKPVSRWLISLAINDGQGAGGLPGHIYFSISTNDDGDYFVIGAATSRPPGCPGETPPEADELIPD
jgi:hypothetical protein